MFDVVLRAIRHPKDFGAIVHQHDLTFIDKQELGHNTVEFNFASKRPITWKTGQHGIFTLPNKFIHGKKWRVFSLASSPTEGIIKIGTTIPPEPSSFKQTMLDLKPGEHVSMRGPIGDMYIRPNDVRIVGVAGGIGITPFRAILEEFLAGAYPNKHLEIIYAGKDNYYAFKDVCETAARAANVRIRYVEGPEAVNEAIDNAATTYQNKARYLLSGSPGMITAITKRLTEAGITNICNDPFKGY